MTAIQELLATLPQTGKVDWLGIRPVAREPVLAVKSVDIDVANSIVGDHYAGKPGSKRQVSLIQAEHIEAVSKILGISIHPDRLRRNIVVSGINLLALKERQFKIGDVVLLGTANCPPCSRMEENLGPGGYNAMRGHGGITARVLRSGTVEIGDAVEFYPESM